SCRSRKRASARSSGTTARGSTTSPAPPNRSGRRARRRPAGNLPPAPMSKRSRHARLNARCASSRGARSDDPRTSGDAAALVADVVDEDVLAEAIRASEEGSALVDAGQLIDELREHPALLEHERVDGNALARAALHFLQGLLERAPRRRVGEVGLQAFHVGGRLAVSDHDDLSVAALLPPQELPRELEAVMHVGADVPFRPRELRELLGLELARVEREAEDVQAVARELAADERG